MYMYMYICIYGLIYLTRKENPRIRSFDRSSFGGFQKSGPLLGSPYNQDPRILRSLLGPHIYGNHHDIPVGFCSLQPGSNRLAT